MIMEYTLQSLQSKLGYSFENEKLLIKALSHPSINHRYRRESKKFKPNYERMEFLGDAILNMVIAEALFHKHKDKNEGKLAKKRAYLVCRETIFQIANKFEIGEYIIMADGESKSGGRKNPSNIEDAFEAVIAAIYLDSNLDAVRAFILKWWHDFLESSYQHEKIDPKSALQELLQSKKLPTPEYKLLESSGSSHEPIFKIELKVTGMEAVIGYGESKKETEKKVALLMLEQIKAS